MAAVKFLRVVLIHIFTCLPGCLSVCLCVCLFVCLHALFAYINACTHTGIHASTHACIHTDTLVASQYCYLFHHLNLDVARCCLCHEHQLGVTIAVMSDYVASGDSLSPLSSWLEDLNFTLNPQP